MPEVRVNGIALYYEEHGRGDAILGVHGGGSAAVFWEEAAAELAQRGRAIVYDRRGHFRSERPDPYVADVHVHADDAAGLLDALDAAPAIVIGRSYGGTVALDLALRHPDCVRALVLLEGDVPSLSEEAARWIGALTERLLAVAETDMAKVAQTVIAEVAGCDAWMGLPDAVKQILTANGPALIGDLLGGFPDVTADQLAAVEQPALLVAARDSLQPGFAEIYAAMAAAMPSARVEWVEGGHLVDPAHPVVLSFIEERQAGEDADHTASSP